MGRHRCRSPERPGSYPLRLRFRLRCCSQGASQPRGWPKILYVASQVLSSSGRSEAARAARTMRCCAIPLRTPARSRCSAAPFTKANPREPNQLTSTTWMGRRPSPDMATLYRSALCAMQRCHRAVAESLSLRTARSTRQTPLRRSSSYWHGATRRLVARQCYPRPRACRVA
jgi:hypothetical protein